MDRLLQSFSALKAFIATAIERDLGVIFILG